MIISIAVLISLINYPIHSTIIFMFISLLYFGYIIIELPYKNNL